MVGTLHYNRETGNNVAFILAARDHRLAKVKITHVQLEVNLQFCTLSSITRRREHDEEASGKLFLLD